MPNFSQHYESFSRFLSLERSGLFSADRYRATNSDTPSGKYRSLLHFVRFGFFEQRDWNQSDLGTWLIPHVLSRKIAPQHVQHLLKTTERGACVEPRTLEIFCSKHDLSMHSYAFHCAYRRQNYEQAYRHLKEMPMNEAFIHHYNFARRHMKMDGLLAAYQWVLSKELDLSSFNVRFFAAARDVGDAIGHPDMEAHSYNQMLLTAFALQKTPNTDILVRALWQMGFPIIPNGSSLYKQVLRLLPEKLRSKLEHHQVDIQNIGKWANLLNLSTLNSLQKQNYVLSNELEFDEIQKQTQLSGDVLRVRLMSEAYWRQADMPDSQKIYLDAFKSAVEKTQAQFKWILPIPSTLIYDRKRENSSEPTLSYHTISSFSQRYLHFKESPLAGYYHFDRTGFSGWASDLAFLEPDTEIVNNTFDKLRTEILETKLTKYQQTGDTEILPEKFVLIALQVPNDSVMYLANIPRDEMLREVISNLEMTGYDVLIKLHPLDKSRATRRAISKHIDRVDHARLTHAPIHELLSAASAVITVNSGVGLEALVHLKPVIAVGKTDYRNAVIEVDEIGNLKSALFEALKLVGTPEFEDRTKVEIYRYIYVSCFQLNAAPLAFNEMLASLK